MIIHFLSKPCYIPGVLDAHSPRTKYYVYISARSLWYCMWENNNSVTSTLFVRLRHTAGLVYLFTFCEHRIIETPCLWERLLTGTCHDDVIKWNHFQRYWPFVRGIHRSPVNSPHKGQWRGVLMFSFIRAWLNCWISNREAGDLRRHRTHYDVSVMMTMSRLPVSYLLSQSQERTRSYDEICHLMLNECPSPFVPFMYCLGVMLRYPVLRIYYHF